LEFISLDRGLRAAVLWLGSLAREPRTATVLPAGVSLTGIPDGGTTEVGKPAAILYDCDPAVGRAGLVEQLGSMVGAWKIDEHIAYLTSDTGVDTPFARRLRIRAWLPFSERRLLDTLREHGAGRVDVTRRGSPVDTNALERRLNAALRRGNGGRGAMTVALTRVQGAHVAIVCEQD
jgi:hypothetical protein